jgi:thiol-disulfide isomerase/thioredoxin
MRRPRWVISLAFFQAGLIGSAARSETLAVGDPAPRLDVARWVKGEEVAQWEPGRTYVVEFWATWCEPCRKCIPHLTELQKRYRDQAEFIGVSVWEPDPDKVEPFVRKMAGTMDYRVVLDNVPKDAKDGSRGRMADTWLAAAGESGIPVAFIVKDGRIAWIGHPVALDQPLAAVVAGKWDFEAAARQRREKQATDTIVSAVFEKVMSLVRQHQYPEAIAGVDRAIHAMPDQVPRLGLLKVNVLAESGDDEALIAYGSRMLGSTWKEDADALNFLALVIVTTEREPKPSPNLLKLALRAAERANDLNHGESGRILDTLGRVCFASGDPARAAQLEERALKLAERDVPQWRERLDTYRKAAAANRR